MCVIRYVQEIRQVLGNLHPLEWTCLWHSTGISCTGHEHCLFSQHGASFFEWGAGLVQPLQCCKRTLWWGSKQSKFNFQLRYKPFLLHHLRNTNKGYKVTIKCSGILVGPLAEIFSHSPLRTYRTVVPAIWNSPGSSIFQSLLMDLLLESFKAGMNQTPQNEMQANL